jgi:hypothetical protein
MQFIPATKSGFARIRLTESEKKHLPSVVLRPLASGKFEVQSQSTEVRPAAPFSGNLPVAR